MSFLALLGIWVSQSPVLQAGARPSPVEAQTPTWQVVGQIGGPTQAVAVQGSYAYVGVGLRLVVLDVSNPASLREVGATRPLPHFVEGVVVSGTLAYVAAGGSGLRVLDVSDPARPTELGAWDSPGYAEGLALSGSTGYLADGPYGLRVVAVSNPARPTEVGSAYPLNYAFDVALAGRYAYIAAAGAGLLVADISDPARPVEVGSLDTPGYAYGVAVSGTVAYVADGWEGLRLVDISYPTSPREIASRDAPGWAFDVVVKDQTVYLANGWGGVRLLSVTVPGSPVELGSYAPEGGHAAGLYISSGVLYVADRNKGLRLLDLSVPAQPAQVGSHGPMGFADDVAVSGNYAYVAAGPYGLRVVDISDPLHPREVASYATPGYAWCVAVDRGYAYVGSVQTAVDRGGLLVVDVSDPTHPTQAAYLQPQHDRPRNMVIKQGIIYAVDEWGFQVIDISNPFTPTQLSFIQLAGPNGLPDTVGVAVSGTMAYVAQSEDGLKVVDVSDPRNPALIGAYKSADILKAMSVAVVGDMAYVGDNGRLQLFDVSNPKDPKGIGFYQIPGEFDAVTVLADTLYLAGGAAGLQAVDISNRRAPSLAGSFYVPGYTAGLAVNGNYVYVAAEDGGLFILERSVGSAPAAGPWAGRFLDSKPSGQTAPVSMRLPDIPPGAIQARSQATWPPRSSSQAPEIPATAKRHVDGHASAASGNVLTVTSTLDSGSGTLRQALQDARPGDTITFDPVVFPQGSPATIALASGLPALSQGNLTIDGSNAGVILEGRSTSAGTFGLTITSDGNVIRGLQIVNFPGEGLHTSNGKGNTIGGNRTRGKGPSGEGNLLSGNGSGVGIFGPDAKGNRIIGNYIGTDITGMSAVANQHNGVSLTGGASSNTIGGTTREEQNIISGNGSIGVALLGSGTSGNKVVGNYIGLNASGGRVLGQGSSGIAISNGASDNIIGGATPAERNVVTGGGREEIGLGAGAHDNTIAGNYIGTDAAGSLSLGSASRGVSLELGPFNNVIQGNVIGGNGIAGVLISDWGTSGNEVIGNFIGVDATGTLPLGGSGDGIHVNASFNKIGGTNATERNVISGNGGNGIKVGFHSMRDTVIIGNFIGTDSSGSKTVGNGSTRPGSAGIVLTESAYHSFIGGATKEEGNVISGNSGDGIGLSGVGVRHNFIGGNYIGTDANGSALGNQGAGISIANAEHNSVQTNAIAYNGTGIQGGASPYNAIRRNSIHGNSGPGIQTDALPAPAITAAINSSVSGTACPGCAVEVFSDVEDEGRVYEGTTVAGPSGAFTFDKGSPLAGPNVTATATDKDGNTSEFSVPQKVWRRIYLPAVTKER